MLFSIYIYIITFFFNSASSPKRLGWRLTPQAIYTLMTLTAPSSFNYIEKILKPLTTIKPTPIVYPAFEVKTLELQTCNKYIQKM